MKILDNVIRILFFVVFIVLMIKGKMMLLLALYVLSLFIALAFGRVYCGYVCPMNTLMKPTERLSKKLKLQTDKFPKWLRSGNFTWLALVLSILIMLFAKRILHKNIPILLIWLLVAVLVTLRYKAEVFHNLICPFSPLQKIFGRFARYSERVEKEKCIGCKICEKDCPSGAIKVKEEDKKAEIRTELCFQCRNCEKACPTDAINYSK